MFKMIELKFDGGDRGTETQVYVTDQSATEKLIRLGDDRGVVCLCIDVSKAELLVQLLNEHQAAGGNV